MEMILIKDLKDKENVTQQFIISSVNKSFSTNGTPYLRLTLKDISGVVAGVKWNLEDGDIDLCENGKIVKISGVLETYRNNLQINITKINSVSDNEIESFRFIKNAPLSKDEMMEQLDYYISLIKDTNLHELVKEIIYENIDKFSTYPAAVSVHHDYIGGLLYHTLTMAKIGLYLCDIYSFIDKEMLISGILLHDVGKTIEFDGNISYHYTLQGKLLGHISIMIAIIDYKARQMNIENDEKVILLKHMILSHHGEYEFGSPVLPQTGEAMLLNLIDNLDSKMEITNKALTDIKKGEYSQKIFALDNRILYKEN